MENSLNERSYQEEVKVELDRRALVMERTFYSFLLSQCYRSLMQCLSLELL